MDAAAIDATFLLSRIAETTVNKRAHGESTIVCTSASSTVENERKQTLRNAELRTQRQQFAPPISRNDLESLRVPREADAGSVIDSAEGEQGTASIAPASFSSLSRRQQLEKGTPAFDAVFTNAALHWVRTPRAVISGVKRVLRPGGRFVGEFGGHGNMAAVRVAMHSALWRRGVDPLVVDPWFFPTAAEYRGLLEEVSTVQDIEENPPTNTSALINGAHVKRVSCPL